MASNINSKNYWQRAKSFVEPQPADERWIALQIGQTETNDWALYFKSHLKWMPRGMMELARQHINVFMVPCVAPWNFDLGYPQPNFVAPQWPPRHFKDSDLKSTTT